MSNALSIYNQFDQIQKAAGALAKSGFFQDVKSEAQAIVKVMAGAELGLPPFASMTGISIIKGKPVLGANLIAALVKNDPRYNYIVAACDNQHCVIEWFENNKPVGDSEFTMQEAKNAGLAGKDNWQKYPSDMLFARAISRGAKRFAPGIFGGSPVYTPDELGEDVDPDGYIDIKVIEPEHEDPLCNSQPEPTTSGADAPNGTDSAGTVVLTYRDGSTVQIGSSDTAKSEQVWFTKYVEAHEGQAPQNVFNLRQWKKNVLAAQDNQS